jgi:hypothetical protein
VNVAQLTVPNPYHPFKTLLFQSINAHALLLQGPDELADLGSPDLGICLL